jgi:hypothetical protein
MPERKAFLLRIDPGLWAELESWAADELRSVNGQIEYLLKQAAAKRKGFGNETPGPGSPVVQSSPAIAGGEIELKPGKNN